MDTILFIVITLAVAATVFLGYLIGRAATNVSTYFKNQEFRDSVAFKRYVEEEREAMNVDKSEKFGIDPDDPGDYWKYTDND
jgi:hypothetical protein